MTIPVAAFVGGGISGGAYNPAVGLGPIIANILSGGEVSVTHFWNYLAGPFCGAKAAAAIYHVQYFGELRMLLDDNTVDTVQKTTVKAT